MSNDDNTLSEKLNDVTTGLARAQTMTRREAAKESLTNWREMAGMGVGLAALIDGAFVLTGLAIYVFLAGPIGLLGLIAVAIGAFGLLEKGVRRLR